MATETRPQTLPLNGDRLCSCPPNHLNRMTAKEWIKARLGVWQADSP